MLTIYGIKNCNTMKKAFDFLNQNGVDYEFFDYKKSSISQAEFDKFLQLFGEKTVNRQGTTYRKFDDDTKAILMGGDALAMYEIVKGNQSVLKRPMVLGELNGKNIALIGFDEQKWTEVLL